jgi:hypothetical protein
LSSQLGVMHLDVHVQLCINDSLSVRSTHV